MLPLNQQLNAIRIFAYFEIEPTKRREFFQLCQQLVKFSRQEAGCLHYELVASTSEPNQFVMVEVWRDEASIAHHNQTTHFQTYVPQLAECLSKPVQVQRYQAIF